MILNILVDVVKETVRLFLEISPYLLLGFFFAGLLHTLLGEAYIKKHFAVSGLLSTVKAAVFGVPLPVCSCAVIPLAESLRRDGASKSATMSFLVSTPSSGVDSIMATYALMGPVYAVFRPIASFFSGILVGVVTHWQEKRNGNGGKTKSTKSNAPEIPHPEDKKKANAKENQKEHKKITKKSFREVFVYGFRVLPSEMAGWLIMGVVIGGAITALVPDDFVARHLSSPVLSYLVVLLVSIPIYVCATGSIPIAASLIAKGIMPGAALAFLIAGPATNTVTISFLYKKMGAKITAIYILSIITVSVVSGVLFDWMWITFGLKIDGVETHGGHLAHYIKIVSAVILMGVFVMGKVNFSAFFRKFKKNKEDNMAANNYKIKVPDMNCAHCKMKIEGALKDMNRIDDFVIDLQNREVEVQTDLEKEVIITRIQEEGYHPEG